VKKKKATRKKKAGAKDWGRESEDEKKAQKIYARKRTRRKKNRIG